jgi:hypothetical protein
MAVGDRGCRVLVTLQSSPVWKQVSIGVDAVVRTIRT